MAPTKDLAKTIEEFKPTILIEISTTGGLLPEQVVRSTLIRQNRLAPAVEQEGFPLKSA